MNESVVVIEGNEVQVEYQDGTQRVSRWKMIKTL